MLNQVTTYSPSGPAISVPMVLTIADLQKLNGADFLVGSQTYVKATDSYYKFKPADTSVPDGSTVVAGKGGGNWLLISTITGGPTQPQTQATVFIDPQNTGGSGIPNTNTASDTNDGTSISKAFASGQRYMRQFGTVSPVISQPTVVSLLSDQQPTDVWLSSPHLVGSGKLTVNGTLVQQGTATIGTFTARNRVAGTRNTITAQGQGGAFWTPFVGMLVNDTTANAWFRIHADNGSATATITEPLASSFNIVPLVPAYVTIANGDALVMYSMPKLQAAIASVGSLNSQGRQPTYQRVDFSYGVMKADTCIINECTFTGSVVGTPLGLGFVRNCFFKSGAIYESCASIIGGGMRSTFAQLSAFSISSNVVDGDFLCDAASLHLGQRMQVGRVSFNVGIDCDYSGLLVECGTADTAGLYYADAEIWGTGNLPLRGGATMYIQSASTAANVMLLTGGFTIDGLSTAFPWVAGSNAYGAAQSITGANIDTYLSLSNPATGTRIAKRA
jgi:hypothetical protein